MAAIAQRDYQTLLNCVGRFYECESLDHFPLVVLTEILKLVGAESSTFNYLAPSVPKVVTVATPSIPDQDNRTKNFAQFLPQHTVLTNFLSTGNPGAFKLSDFQSEREYHALPLYQEFYREIQYEDQLSIFLFPPGAEMVGISLARNRRTFTERDRQILDLLRPHIARAFRHVERHTLHQRLFSRDNKNPSSTLVSTITLGARNRPVQFAAEAQQWIKHFFSESSGTPSQLPQPITEWLARASNGKKNPHTPSSPSMLQERDGQRLRISIYPKGPSQGRILVLGLETIPQNARSLKSSGLTQREIDVLLEVEKGKTNGEVSTTLGISPLTVRCHLEHIFEKLNVPSRTAAVTRFRQLCQSSTSLNPSVTRFDSLHI